MKKSLLKDTIRQIVKYPGRFLSIFTIVAIGAAFFAGIKTAAPNMKYTADQYYDEYNMMDLRLLSTMGFVEEDLTAVKEVEGVKKAQTSYFQDVVATIGSNEMVFRIHSLPKDTSGVYLNEPKLLSGRLPEGKGECIIEENKNFPLGLEIGDVIEVSSGKKEDLSDKLKSTSFTVVGKAESPYYLTFDKDATDIGSGKVNFFMMISEEEFLYPVYLEILVEVDGAKELNSYSSAYERKVELVRNKLENLGADRAILRLDDIKKEAEKKLAEARDTLAKEEENYNKEIAAAEKELTDARDQLVEGEATLETEKKNYAERVADAESQIRDGERALASAQNEYNEGLREYNQAKEEYGDDLAQLNDASNSLKNVQADAITQRQAVTEMMQNASSPEELESLSNQLATLNELISTTNEGINTITGLNDYAQSRWSVQKTSWPALKNSWIPQRRIWPTPKVSWPQKKEMLKSSLQPQRLSWQKAEKNMRLEERNSRRRKKKGKRPFGMDGRRSSVQKTRLRSC